MYTVMFCNCFPFIDTTDQRPGSKNITADQSRLVVGGVRWSPWLRPSFVPPRWESSQVAK